MAKNLEYTKYENNRGNSGVVGFAKNGEDSLYVFFHSGACYEYTKNSCGDDIFETMLEYAYKGRGLNAFINLVVKKKYERIVSK